MPLRFHISGSLRLSTAPGENLSVVRMHDVAMATIRKEIEIHASPQRVWEALSDVGALHTRLAAGFVVETRMEGNARIVTFRRWHGRA